MTDGAHGMTTGTYTNLLYLAAGLELLCAVGVVWRRDLAASVRLLAVQGAALAAIGVVSGIYRDEADLIAVGLGVLVLRAAVLPWLIARLIPAAGVARSAPAVLARLIPVVTGPDAGDAPAGASPSSRSSRPSRAWLDLDETREPEPLVGTATALLLTAALTLLAYAVSRPVVELAPGPATVAAPAALAVIGIGMLVLITRRHAVAQLIGFLTLDNGIAALAFLLTSGVPLVVELGASLDLLLVVVVVAALAVRIRGMFGGTDLGELRELHE